MHMNKCKTIINGASAIALSIAMSDPENTIILESSNIPAKEFLFTYRFDCINEYIPSGIYGKEFYTMIKDNHCIIKNDYIMNNEILPYLSEYIRSKNLKIYFSFQIISVQKQLNYYKITGICQNEIIELCCFHYIDTAMETIINNDKLKKDVVYRTMILKNENKRANIIPWKIKEIGQDDIYMLERSINAQENYIEIRNYVIDLLYQMKENTKDTLLSAAEIVDLKTDDLIYVNNDYYVLSPSYPKNIFDAFYYGERFWREYIC